MFSSLIALNALLQPDPLVWGYYAVLISTLSLLSVASEQFKKYADELQFAKYIVLNSVVMLRIPLPWILFALQVPNILYSLIPSIFMACFVANLSPLWALWFATCFSSIFFAVEYGIVRLCYENVRMFTDGTNVQVGYIRHLPSSLRQIKDVSEVDDSSKAELNGVTLCFQMKKKPDVIHEEDTTEDDEWHLEQATSMSSDAEIEKLDLPDLEEPTQVNGKEEAEPEEPKQVNGKEEAEEPKSKEEAPLTEDEENIKTWLESRSHEKGTEEEVLATKYEKENEEEQASLPDYLHPRVIP